MRTDIKVLKQNYERDGFVSGVKIVEAGIAATHCKAMESAESKMGALHYKPKVHTILQSPLELAVLPRVLDIIEGLIGPNILLYNVTYIVKEPRTLSHVSWHQDLMYWGLSHDDQVSIVVSPLAIHSGKWLYANDPR